MPPGDPDIETCQGQKTPPMVEDTPPPVQCMKTLYRANGNCAINPTNLSFLANGSMDVDYRVVYTYADGTRSRPSSWTMPLTEYRYRTPWVYVEFSSPIATLLAGGPPGKPRTGIMLQRSGPVAPKGSPRARWNTSYPYVDIVRLDIMEDYWDEPMLQGCQKVSNYSVKCLDSVWVDQPPTPPVSAWRWAGSSTAPTPIYSSLGSSAPALALYGIGGLYANYSLLYEFKNGYRSMSSPYMLWATHAIRSRPSIFVEFSAPLSLSANVSVVLQRYEEEWGLVDVDRIGGLQANGRPAGPQIRMWPEIADIHVVSEMSGQQERVTGSPSAFILTLNLVAPSYNQNRHVNVSNRAQTCMPPVNMLISCNVYSALQISTHAGGMLHCAVFVTGCCVRWLVPMLEIPVDEQRTSSAHTQDQVPGSTHLTGQREARPITMTTGD
ncbi:hypothetical protein VOLCADRAFT_91329 [Volvox carteri f. nagariensis]|uniref:Uncharacterized protein n=1 Tax=Volvox carteri f. nagariensis TaxID=3068 RepID=D8TWS5_VOLCA|nr:uncharacterized protein VOLCADRAFT_91329 [Volvox carteri f. nagariensis]EFJ48201.1 hypothetical protein VOLCADRAFT_91329 [Volvox carteri f. nagariensis]|eukprot:XP_002950886.1 hypothetical protein VOLCADRAFT_91329 [Volvox carteri f. nagariensis]